MTREEAIRLLGFLGANWHGLYLEALDMAISALREQEKPTAMLVQQYIKVPVQPQWVSVEERLPEPLVSVLAWDADWKTAHHAYLTQHKEWCGVVLSHNITHWMPMPEPPKGGDG